MDETKKPVNNPAGAESGLNAGLGSEVVIADGVLNVWLQPMIAGMKSDDLRPFLCAIASQPKRMTNIMAALENVLLALDGRDVKISVLVRPNV